jgi:hypothetical protein
MKALVRASSCLLPCACANHVCHRYLRFYRNGPRPHAVAKLVLAAPKLAAKRAAEATKSQRPAAEAAIVAAVQDCLHFAGALRPVMAVLSEAVALEVAEQLLGLFALAQPLLSQHAAGCLLQLVQAAPNTRSLTAAQVLMLLKVLPAAVHMFVELEFDTSAGQHVTALRAWLLKL